MFFAVEDKGVACKPRARFVWSYLLDSVIGTMKLYDCHLREISRCDLSSWVQGMFWTNIRPSFVLFLNQDLYNKAGYYLQPVHRQVAVTARNWERMLDTGCS